MTDRTTTGIDRAARTSFWLVAIAAGLWGTDALFRRGLALELAPTAVVFFEHLLLVAATLPWLRRIRWRELEPRHLVALVIIGGGSSAIATTLFTAAFRYGDPNAPLLLQKLQPLIAVLAAQILLGERQDRRFWGLLIAGVAGAYLIAFSDPAAVTVESLLAAGLAVGAAALWAMGTVLGRLVTPVLAFRQLTAARFAFGLPAAAVLMVVVPTGGSPLLPAAPSGWLALVGLALVPGLAALLLYYRGLADTPASAATVAELGFPATALVVNYLAFGATVTVTQAAGLVLLSGTLIALSALLDPRSSPIRIEEVQSREPAA